ncbi:MAG: hypothetical protein ACU85E_00640 [Gammaproteobacteria bacterium]
MKQILFSVLILASVTAFADDAKNEWHNTTLSDATIKKIQAVKYQYNKCIVDEMKATAHLKRDVREATEAIVKKCENYLNDIRQVYLDAKVPEVIIKRHQKQIRIQTTRNVLKQMMFAEAARKAGQQSK